MRILAVDEIVTGTDEVMSAQFFQRRQSLGVSLTEAAEATGAEARELALIEGGELAAFADRERLRRVVLAYCDYLGFEPGPILARLEAYADWELLNPPDLFKPQGPDDPAYWGRPSLGFLVFGLAIVFLVGWAILHAVGYR